MSTDLVPPEHAERLAELGAPIAEFRVGKLTLILLLGLTVGAIFVGLVLGLVWLLWMLTAQGAQDRAIIALSGAGAVVYLYYVLVWRRKHHPDAKAHLTAHLGHILGFGTIYLYSGVGGWLRAKQLRGLRVIVFPAGLARIQADAVDVIRWEEITTVRRAILWEQDQETPLDGAIRLSLETADGREYEFDEALSGLRELRKLVELYTLPRMLYAALDEYESGRDVSFGVVKASRRGLSYGGRCLLWKAYESARTAKGQLVVKALGRWRSLWKIRLLEVPNVHVLIALAEYVRRYEP